MGGLVANQLINLLSCSLNGCLDLCQDMLFCLVGFVRMILENSSIQVLKFIEMSATVTIAHFLHGLSESIMLFFIQSPVTSWIT